MCLCDPEDYTDGGIPPAGTTKPGRFQVRGPVQKQYCHQLLAVGWLEEDLTDLCIFVCCVFDVISHNISIKWFMKVCLISLTKNIVNIIHFGGKYFS